MTSPLDERAVALTADGVATVLAAIVLCAPRAVAVSLRRGHSALVGRGSNGRSTPMARFTRLGKTLRRTRRRAVPDLLAFNHVDVTVTDLERSAQWWQDVMGFTVVNRDRGPTFDFVSLMNSAGVVVTVMTHDARLPGEFDERRVGLDHLAFLVADRAELEQWVDHLATKGVPNSGLIDAHFGSHLVFRDPDNFQLELFVPDAATVQAARELID
jgi:catechol-2,3-dioxygenase